MVSKNVKIGYQGVVGSNSFFAAQQMAASLGLSDVEFVPLVSSQGVISALEFGKIDYGVVATKNSIGGEVRETMEALKGKQLSLARTCILPIHHCLFKRNAAIPDSNITAVASHIQALKQTTETIAKRFPSITSSIEIDDTARGADMLADGELPESTAVICSAEAGTRRGLHMMARNIEDSRDNRTEFRLFRKPDAKFVESANLTEQIVDDSHILEWLGRGALAVIIFASLWAMESFKWSPLDSAIAISGYIIVGVVAWATIKKALINRTFIGYWKYYTVPLRNSDTNDDQHYHVPRIVEIKEVDGKLHIRGYAPNAEATRICFGADKVIVENSGRSTGILIYEYGSDLNALDLGGYVVLNWYKRHFFSKVKRMTGKYFGIRSREMGTLTYQRISRSEFDDIRRCEFLN